jgi:hypothetical protein
MVVATQMPLVPMPGLLEQKEMSTRKETLI